MTNVSVAGSYEQYKLDTSRFIFWLVVTARDKEYKIDDPAITRNTTNQQPSKRLKGKERKQAKEAAASKVASLSASSTASKGKYSISTETILKLATHIAGKDMTSTMPKFVWYSYKRAVRTRQAYADRYAQEELSDRTSDSGHIYFLWLLKYCHEILEKKIKVQSLARPVTAKITDTRYSIATAPISAVTSHPTPTSAPEARNPTFDIVADEDAAAEAEKEAVGHEVDELARKFELNLESESKEGLDIKRHEELKTRTQEELALRKSCLTDDMRKAIIQLERDWEDTYKDAGADDYLDETRATLMTEAAFDLIRHKEEALVEEANEKGLPAFDPSLNTDEFFGKTARSLERIEAERRRSNPGYLFLASRLTAADVSAQLYSEEGHEFLVHYLHESGLEHEVRKRHEKGFRMPILKGAFDAPSRTYGSLGTWEHVSMVITFAAELAIRIRSKSPAHSLRHYRPMLDMAMKEENQFASWQNKKINFDRNSWQVTESARTLRSFIIGRPFSPIRYVEMRLLNSTHPLYGLQCDYPQPSFRTKEAREELMKSLENQGIEDNVGNTLMRQEFAAHYILPPRDGDFLRMTIPTLRAKLSLTQLLLREEMGLGFANASPQIFALCHLYNCFLKRGLITGVWPEIELMMDWHLEEIFLNEVPTKLNEFYSRLLLATGYSSKAIKQIRNVKENPDRYINFGKPTNKTSELKPLPMTRILRDYVHEREKGVQIWHRMNKDIIQNPGNSSMGQDTSNLDILSFIKNVRSSEQLLQLPRQLEFDYISLTLQCNEICHKIDIEQERLFKNRTAKDEAHWKSPTQHGFSIVSTLLGDLDRIFLLKENGRKQDKGIADTTPVVDVAARVLQEFIDGLKS
ncbi:hypothetical protein ACET3X_002876 [Alternaria dauci]|uniref:DUF6604 domain-containing protein n=1 Tax=Alternaria dauci TaxID=48095 RepID=A0ABR3USP6_9PLEO